MHALAPVASCRACVDACPRAAWSLDDEGLKLDVEVCDGCGLCAPACPQDAVMYARPVRPLVQTGTDCITAFAACDRVIEPEEPGRVPCLHAIGLRDLTKLYARGVRRLVVSCGACEACPRNSAASLDQNVSDLALLLLDRNIPNIEYIKMEPGDWRCDRDEAGRMSRRNFFRTMAPVQALAISNAEEHLGPTTAFAVLPSDETAHIAPVVPRIDATSCRACGACLELCPHDVIKLAGKDDGNPRYQIDAGTCTGCGLCVDVCDVDAVRLTQWADPRPPSIILALGQCGSCGNTYHKTIESNSGTNRCHICATGRHQQSLFQVLP